ncbi:hypothetical protein [Peribacillus sp. NPDC096540]|uniref:hypothetical protein n=1 Tax=Peribacillus sp. NPDC096540 TaxID=3390612 RepID=UPI003D0236A0
MLNNEISRDEFNVWAYKWVENFDSRNRLSPEEDELHSYLINLLAIDLEIDKGVYFHEDEEIEEWIKKIKNGKSLL